MGEVQGVGEQAVEVRGQCEITWVTLILEVTFLERKYCNSFALAQ